MNDANGKELRSLVGELVNATGELNPSDDEDFGHVEFEEDVFHDFQIDLNKSRSVLGYDPKYSIIDIIDEAVEFRKRGSKRPDVKYPG